MNLWRHARGVRSTLVSILLLLAAGSEAVRAADTPVDINSLRGVWLERFTRFVDWPAAHRVNQPGQPFELCVLGDKDFAALLKSLYAKQTIKTKPVRVQALDAGANLSHCDLLFLAEQPVASRDSILKQAFSQATLVISASAGYAEAGSHINLYEESGFLRFEINLDSIQQAGLTVSSHLLKIARVVRHKEAN